MSPGHKKTAVQQRTVKISLGRVADILEASGAFDPGSSPGRGATHLRQNSFLELFVLIVL